MHYPLTREQAGDDFLTLDEAFDELLYGFNKWVKRHSIGSYQAVYASITRGWMTERFADLFTDYCIPGWRIV